MEAKILIVDDEIGITDSLTRYFRLMGYNVDSSNDPQEALNLVLKENYMIVISDIMMPGMSGIELLKKIKKYNGMIQVIMMTGVVTIENVLSCLGAGANECMLKPLDNLEKIKCAVDEAIAKLTRWEELIKTMIKRKA